MWTALGTLLGAGLLGGASLWGSAMGSASSDYAAKKSYDAQIETNKLNYQMFKENQAWTERMANTAHQREVSDLREAGLNPILSATGGSGAATPTLASPVATSPGSPVADKSAIYQGFISSLIQSCSTASDVVKKFAESEKDFAIIDKEIGKRHLPAYLDNTIREHAGELNSAAKQVIGILKDLNHAAANNFSVMKKTLFQDFRQTKQMQINNARSIPGTELMP